jgi:hypothetical protein
MNPTLQLWGTEQVDRVCDMLLCERIPGQLSEIMRNELFEVMRNAREVFKAKVGLLPGAPYDVELTKRDPIRLKPYPVPHSLHTVAKEEVERYVRAGILCPVL